MPMDLWSHNTTRFCNVKWRVWATPSSEVATPSWSRSFARGFRHSSVDPALPHSNQTRNASVIKEVASAQQFRRIRTMTPLTRHDVLANQTCVPWPAQHQIEQEYPEK